MGEKRPKVSKGDDWVAGRYASISTNQKTKGGKNKKEKK